MLRVGSQTCHAGFFVLFVCFFFVCLFVFVLFFVFFAVYELRANTCWGEGSYNAVMCPEPIEHDCSKWSRKFATCLLLCFSFTIIRSNYGDVKKSVFLPLMRSEILSMMIVQYVLKPLFMEHPRVQAKCPLNRGFVGAGHGY